MPYRPTARRCPRCGITHRGPESLCAQCRAREPKKERPSRQSRGYGPEWQKIRKEVLRAYGIPESDWPLYRVDHNPPYNKELMPDHRAYDLIPRLEAEHNSKTAREDTARDSRGRFSGKRGGGL